MKTTHTFPDDWVARKNVLFITTKNLNYIRNAQEIACLRRSAGQLQVIGCEKGGTISRLLRVWLRLLFLPVRSYDVVFIGFAPQLILPFWGWKFRKQTVVADFFISFYETLVFDRQIFRTKSLAAALAHRLDTTVCQRADRVFADTCADADYFIRKFGLTAEKTKVFYLEADMSVFYPRESLPARLGPTEKFVVLYFGSILPLQGVDVILQCVRLMRQDTSIVFNLIGPVPQKERRLCADLPNVHFTDWLPQNDLAERIAQADLCLAGHFNARIQKACRTIPGKAYIYHAMGKPMILGDNPANHELFDENGKTVYYVRMGDAGSLAEKIRQIALHAVQ